MRLPTGSLRAVLVSAALATASFILAEDRPLKYPETKRTDHTDTLHGEVVADPYRWLEADVRKSKEVAEWVEEENRLTFAYLEKLPARTSIRKRLTELWNYERFSAPVKIGGRTFYSRNDGLQNQAVLYMQSGPNAEARIVLDPNSWTKDGTAALSGWSCSDDGRFLAYARSDKGSDWSTWKIQDLDTGKDLPDEVQWTKFTGAQWTKDGKGFFYTGFEAPPEAEKFTSLNLNARVRYHRVGTSQADDVLVYRRPDHPEWGFSNTVSDDGRYLIMEIWKGTDHKYRVVYRDLLEPYALPIDLIENFDNEYSFVGNDGPIFYFKTDLEAPRSRVIAIDTRHPERKAWKEIIPQTKNNLTGVNLVGNLFLASYLEDAATRVILYRMDGTPLREVALPGIGTASGFGGMRGDTETYYTFMSFATPPTIYHYDLLTGESKVFRKSNVQCDPEAYEVKRVFYPSKDGKQKIPLFLTYKKGLKRDGNNPVLLYGYGGFNIPLTPTFSVGRLAWLEMGGVYAQACLRGGGEYGEEWHHAGTRLQKQNVFDDFIGAAEYLIAEKITQPAKLAIQGGSNGGLLVGAVMTQRPDLFGACLPAVGVMDMLRFHKFTAGRYWVDDYGSPEDEKEFKALLAYSPLHNLKKGVKYPATLITTANTDDRVVPGHSFKFAAQLQYCQGGPAPVLIRIETSAGHGAGKPTAKIIEEAADQYAFLVKNLGMKIEK